MGLVARLKDSQGSGSGNLVRTLTAAATLDIPGGNTHFNISGSTAITAFRVPHNHPKRTITFTCTAGNVTFTGTAVATVAAGTYAAGATQSFSCVAGSLNLFTLDSVSFRQDSNGGWHQVSAAHNT